MAPLHRGYPGVSPYEKKIRRNSKIIKLLIAIRSNKEESYNVLGKEVE